MIRATTSGMLKNYRYQLNKSFTKLNDARNTVSTERTFNSFAEDPAAAAKTFQLRQARMTVEAQYTTCDEVLRKYQSAWSSLESVINDVDNMTANSVKESMNRALNDPTGDARSALGKELNELADTLIQTMNNKYADNFIFSGADGQTVPFSWGAGGELLYRGVPVDAAVPEVETDDATGAKLTVKLNAAGQYDPANGTDSYLVSSKTSYVEFDPTDALAAPPDNALQDTNGNAVLLGSDGNYYDVNTYPGAPAGTTFNYVTVESGGTITPEEYAKAESDVAKLDYLSSEKYFVDIGQGNQEDENSQVIESSAFNAALNGINFLGYGLDEDGDPKNIVSLIKQMAQICNTGSGILSKEEYDTLDRLVSKTEAASDNLHNMHTELDAGSNKLNNNSKLLEDSFYNLQEQYLGIEKVDPAEAITAFLYASYSYNAALRMGNSLLSQSLMDYLQ